ncbi:MAG TPA: hypothetical protein VEH86_07845 [Candidatus Acidoferrum sp.]|nr:hypothetical protein [Candidatus Acidoferrum sp.]
MFGCTTSEHCGYTLKTEKNRLIIGLGACSFAQHPKTADKLFRFMGHSGLGLKAAKTDARQEVGI